MGQVNVELTLKNAEDKTRAKDGHIKTEEIRQTIVEAVVDTGAGTLIINEETRQKLGLDNETNGIDPVFRKLRVQLCPLKGHKPSYIQQRRSLCSGTDSWQQGFWRRFYKDNFTRDRNK